MFFSGVVSKGTTSVWPNFTSISFPLASGNVFDVWFSNALLVNHFESLPNSQERKLPKLFPNDASNYDRVVIKLNYNFVTIKAELNNLKAIKSFEWE